MISINTQDELSLYNLEGKWNDFIAVQKEVITVLKAERYFVDNVVHNLNGGLNIKINPKGIKETIGAGKRFQKLPRKLKEYKISTLRYLKKIIETAELLTDDVPNYHAEGVYSFAYLKSEIIIDGIRVDVRVSVMKRIDSNWFWIHHIDEKEKSPKLLDPPVKAEFKEI